MKDKETMPENNEDAFAAVMPREVSTPLLRHYGLSGVQVERVCSISAGPASCSWLVELTKNGEELKWCVKKHRSEQKDRVFFELQFCHLLSKSGFPLAPRMVPTSDGEILACGDSQSFISVSEYVECDRHFDWTEGGWSREQTMAAGSALAQFHTYASTVGAECEEYRGLALVSMAPSCAPQLRSALTASLQRAGSLAASATKISSPAIAIATDSHAQLVAAFNKTFDLSFGSYGDRQELLHGDFHPANVLFRKSQVAAVLDMDYIQVGPPLYDIGYGAFTFAQCGERDDLIDAFIQGYNEQAFSTVTTGRGHPPQPVTATSLRPWLTLSALVVAYWLLDVTVDATNPDEVRRIQSPLLSSLKWALALT